MLISQTDIRHNDLSECVLNAVGGNREQFKAIEEYVTHNYSIRSLLLMTS